MGVSQYYLRYIKNYLAKRVQGLIQTRLTVRVDTLHLDANALVHHARNMLFEYPEEKTSAVNLRRIHANRSLSLSEQYRLLAEQTWTLITEITSSVRPRQALTIMFDGVVPVAKMKQQRARRFHHTGDVKTTYQGIEIKTKAIGPNDISVSTDLMEYLHLYIEQQIDRLPLSGDLIFPPTIIYSSHHRPGEGEHKILDAFRHGDVPVGPNYHMLWGLDNDLFQLGLLLPTDRVILGRDDGEVEFVFLDVLKNYLKVAMGYVDYVPGQGGIDDPRLQGPLLPTPGISSSRPLIQLTVEDKIRNLGVEYIALMTLVGNDFLPRVVGVNSLDFDVPVLLDAYRRLKLQRPTAYLVDRHGTIDRQSWVQLLKLLLDHQWDQIAFQARNPRDSAFWANVGATLKLKKPNDRERFRQLYYQREYEYLTYSLLASTYDPNKPAPVVEPMDDQTKTELIEGMCYFFVQGITWVVNYYHRGRDAINQTYYYPYYTAPMFEDLIAYLESDNYVDDAQWSRIHGSNLQYNALDQLLMTAPDESSMLSWWPQRLRELHPQLRALAPKSFMTTSDTGNFEWYHQPLLPPLDPEAVHALTQFSEEDGAELDGEPLPPQFRQSRLDLVKLRTFQPPAQPPRASRLRAMFAPPRERRVNDATDVMIQSLGVGFRRSRASGQRHYSRQHRSETSDDTTSRQPSRAKSRSRTPRGGNKS